MVKIYIETDYVKLFENYWCPLLGRLPTPVGIPLDSDDQTNRIKDIIRDARQLWGIKPFQETVIEVTTQLTVDQTKEPNKYPKWKLDSAQNIVRTHLQVKENLYNEDLGKVHEVLDKGWERAVDLVRNFVKLRLNKQIKDHHILAILAIVEAWEALKQILYHKKARNDPSIMNQVQVAGNLLAQANNIAAKDKVESLRPKAEYADKKLLKDNAFHRIGDNWEIVYDGKPTSLKDTKGLEYIAHLLDNTGQRIRANDLRNMVEKKILIGGRDTVKYGQLKEEDEKEDTGTLPQDDAKTIRNGVDVVLDDEAIKECKKELKELKTDLEEAIKYNDLGNKDRIEGEINFIKSQMVADGGLKDHPRKFKTKEDADRKDISTNVHRAYKKLKKAHKPLWIHLEKNIKISSYYCSYSLGKPINWNVKF